MMDKETAARLVRAARALVRKDPEDFAAAIGIGVSTLKRVEAGYPVSGEVLGKLVAGFAAAGIEVTGPTRTRPDVAIGVALLARADVGAEKPLKTTARSSSRKLIGRREDG